MKKQTKGLLASVAVLVILGGGLVALKLTEPEQTEESSITENTDAVTLWSVESDSIKQVTVENPNADQSYVVTRKMETVDTTDIDGNAVQQEVANYFLTDMDDLPMNTTEIRLLATRAASLTSEQVVLENASEDQLAAYGLDKPITVTFQVDDAEDIVFEIGDATPDADYTYLMVQGDQTVYTVSTYSIEPFLKEKIAYLSTTLTEEQADDDETYVESVRIDRADLEYDFYFTYDSFYVENSSGGSSAVHVMEEPINCLLNAEKSASATHGIYGLTASEVKIPYPTEAQMTECGFDAPFAIVTTKTSDGKTIVFRLGSTYESESTDEEGNVTKETRWYGYLDGVNCIYGFAADNIIYEDMKPEDVTSKIIVDTYVWDIGRLTYTAGDLKLDFEGKGTSSDDYVLTLNGEEADPERFRLLYTYLLKTGAEDLVLEEVTPTGDPMASIHLERQDGKRTTDVAFYDVGGLKAYIAVNGEVRFRCRKAYVETLIQNLQIYNTDEDFTMNW